MRVDLVGGELTNCNVMLVESLYLVTFSFRIYGNLWCIFRNYLYDKAWHYGN